MAKTSKKWVVAYEIESSVDYEADEPINYDEALELAYEEGTKNLRAFVKPVDPE